MAEKPEKTADILAEKPEKKTAIIIQNDPNDPLSLVVNGSVNSKNFSIQRGKRVLVSDAILEVLKNAKGINYYQEGDKVMPSEALSHPFSIVE